MKIVYITEYIESWKSIARDPRASKLIAIAFKQDKSVPMPEIVKAGLDPTDEKIVDIFAKGVNDRLSQTAYGDATVNGKFNDWIARQYMNGHIEWEDISQLADLLGGLRALLIRGKLKPQHQDINRFHSYQQLQRVLSQNIYQDDLKRIQDAEKIEKAKKEAQAITLIDDDRVSVIIPLNYGACYVFNNAEGVIARFCTGSSSGLNWFERYTKDGPIISIFDKQNPDSPEGKWQLHAATSQFKNAPQTTYVSDGQEKFVKQFENLGPRILQAIKDKSAEVQAAGYDPEQVIQSYKRTFPNAFNPVVSSTGS